MLATNLIPNELRYQLEFGDLPARAVSLSPTELMFVSGGGVVKTCRPNTARTCPKINGQKRKCVSRFATAGPYKVDGDRIEKGEHGKPPRNPKDKEVHICVNR